MSRLPQPPRSRTVHNETFRKAETTQIKRLRRKDINHNQKSLITRKTKQRSLGTNNLLIKKLITARTGHGFPSKKETSSYHNNATCSNRQQRERADIQKGIYGKCHMKGECGTRLASQTLMFTLLKCTGSCDLQSKHLGFLGRFMLTVAPR